MTREDIIRIAQECQLIGMRPHLDGIYEEALERFAALVAAAEREACAKTCEAQRNIEWITASNARVIYEPANVMADSCAAAIRARGESK